MRSVIPITVQPRSSRFSDLKSEVVHVPTQTDTRIVEVPKEVGVG